MEELITVALPIYNVEKYLPKCLDSVLAQTYKNLEIILVVDDDGSDNSSKICDEYAKKDERIKVFHKKSGGLSAARNLALEVSRGNYITFVDSDDWIEPTYVEELYDAIKKYGCDMSICGHVQKYEDGRFFSEEKVESVKIFKNENPLLMFYGKRRVSHYSWAKLYKKSVFENVRFPIGIYNQDTYVIPALCENIKNGIVVIPSTLYNYLRMREGSATKEVSEKSFNIIVAKRHNVEVIDKGFCEYKSVCVDLFYAYKHLYEKIRSRKDLVKRLNKEFGIDWKKYKKFLPTKTRIKFFIFKNFRFVFNMIWER